MGIAELILQNLSGQSKNIFRLKYTYDFDIAKKVWLGIAHKYIDKNIEFERDNKKVWNELIKYAFGDTSCIYSLDKGICLIGKTGSGKTKTMEILNQFMLIDDIRYKKDDKYIRMKYKIVSAKSIVGDYMTNGYASIDFYSDAANLCIDDLGAESTQSKHYGTSINVIEEVIENRYLNGKLTHYTSNIKPEDVHEIYGARIYSRLMHSANIIIMNDKDFRLT